MRLSPLSNCAVLSLFFLISCSSIGQENQATTIVNASTAEEPDDLEQAETVFIKSPDGSATKFSTEPANIESISVFVRDLDSGAVANPKKVDVLVKGVFPDGCSELHELISEVKEGVISYELLTRRPKGQMCTQAIRPFRFQFPIDSIQPGSYTIMVNDRNLAFKVEK